MGFEFYKQKFRNNIVCSFNVFFSFINENRTCDNFCYKPFKRRRDLNAKHYLWCQRRKGKGNQQKKEDITTSEVYLFMQRCSSLYDAVFRQWWCINSCFIFMYSGEYHIWSSKTSFEEFFFLCLFPLDRFHTWIFDRGLQKNDLADVCQPGT